VAARRPKHAAVGATKGIINGSKQAAVGMSKMPKMVAKGSKKAATHLAKASKNIMKGFRPSPARQGSRYFLGEDDDPIPPESALHRGLGSGGSDTIHDSSGSILSAASSHP